MVAQVLELFAPGDFTGCQSIGDNIDLLGYFAARVEERKRTGGFVPNGNY